MFYLYAYLAAALVVFGFTIKWPLAGIILLAGFILFPELVLNKLYGQPFIFHFSFSESKRNERAFGHILVSILIIFAIIIGFGLKIIGYPDALSLSAVAFLLVLGVSVIPQLFYDRENDEFKTDFWKIFVAVILLAVLPVIFIMAGVRYFILPH